jgi:RNA polymerase sigma-70 factor, ECF subfamily
VATVRRAIARLCDVDSSADQLFQHATRGDQNALDQLLQRYLPHLHAFVHARLGAQLRARESSLDVVQSVCRQLLEVRAEFDFRGEDRFRAWLFTAALNKVRERHRRLHSDRRDVDREESDADGNAETVMAHLITPSQEAIGNETAAAVSAALAGLSEEHREVITLARLVRLPHRIIAEVLSRNEEATRQLLARAMVQLTRELRQRGVEVDKGPMQ